MLSLPSSLRLSDLMAETMPVPAAAGALGGRPSPERIDSLTSTAPGPPQGE